MKKLSKAASVAVLVAASGASYAQAQSPDSSSASESPAAIDGSARLGVQTEASSEGTGAQPDRFSTRRGASLAKGNTLDGSTGLLRVVAADSGEDGTLRVGVVANFFSGKGFLCPSCQAPDGQFVEGEDDAKVSGQRLLLSVTPIPFLEAHAALRFQQTSNTLGNPEVIQISGDSSIGVKAFLPSEPGRIFGAGGGVVLGLLSRAGDVGIAAANVHLHAEGTLDLTELAADGRIPLRAHLNAGYLFDNSGAIAESIEEDRSGLLGSSQRITRIERFGHDINRLDSLRLGLGAEGVFPYVRPFAEWTLDIPVNRQDYTCELEARSAGDDCYSRSADFSSLPSRITIGARGYPWLTGWSEGISLLAALDIGTGATSSFVDEVAPELPWSLYLGAGFAFDTRPHIEKVTEQKTVRITTPPPPELYIAGTVIDPSSTSPVEGAAVVFKESEGQGLLTNSAGAFRTLGLKPGLYRFRVTKEGYSEGECEGTVLEPTPAAKPAPKTTGGGTKPPVAPTPVQPPSGPRVTQVRCELKALPTVARIDGTLRDADTTLFVPQAAVSIKDARGRSLKLQTDEQGGFRFENVPSGTARIQVEAEGYLPSAVELQLKPRETLAVQLSVHKRPKQSNVVITKTELRLKKQVHFLHDSAEILPDSQSIVEEIAEALRSHSEIAAIEIQGHTDNTGNPSHNLTLSEKRAGAVRDALLLLGIEPGRLSARGYGEQNPLAPNTTAANKTRNRRVQLMIQAL